MTRALSNCNLPICSFARSTKRCLGHYHPPLYFTQSVPKLHSMIRTLARLSKHTAVDDCRVLITSRPLDSFRRSGPSCLIANLCLHSGLLTIKETKEPFSDFLNPMPPHEKIRCRPFAPISKWLHAIRISLISATCSCQRCGCELVRWNEPVAMSRPWVSV